METAWGQEGKHSLLTVSLVIGFVALLSVCEVIIASCSTSRGKYKVWRLKIILRTFYHGEELLIGIRDVASV